MLNVNSEAYEQLLGGRPNFESSLCHIELDFCIVFLWNIFHCHNQYILGHFYVDAISEVSPCTEGLIVPGMTHAPDVSSLQSWMHQWLLSAFWKACVFICTAGLSQAWQVQAGRPVCFLLGTMRWNPWLCFHQQRLLIAWLPFLSSNLPPLLSDKIWN